MFIVDLPCCSHVAWYFVAWICPAKQWDDCCCPVFCHCVNLLTHCPCCLMKSWITLVRFDSCPICLCLNFYDVLCPPGSCTRWVWLRCLSSFASLPNYGLYRFILIATLFAVLSIVLCPLSPVKLHEMILVALCLSPSCEPFQPFVPASLPNYGPR
jgi:hypothetical protein